MSWERGLSRRLGAIAGPALVLAALARTPAQSPEKPPAPEEAVPAAAPLVPAQEGPRLKAALALKEERRLQDALVRLEAIASARAARPGSGPAELQLAAPGQALTAGALLAELEAIDVRLRLGALEGLEGRLRGLEEAAGAQRDVQRRVRALRSILHLAGGSLLEPNAIARLDVGDRLRARFFPGRGADSPPPIPLDLPIRKLSDLTPGRPPGAARGPRNACPPLVGFLGLEDLATSRRAALQPAFDHFDGDPRALIALFVYTGDAEIPPPATGDEPWSRAAVFWIRGTPAALSSVPVRSRYEWLPGPTFFLLAPGGRIRSWRWPHEGWDGFLRDAQESRG